MSNNENQVGDKPVSAEKPLDKQKIIIAVLAAAVLVLIIGLLVVMKGKSNDDEKTTTDSEQEDALNQSTSGVTGNENFSNLSTNNDNLASNTTTQDSATTESTETTQYPDLYIVKYDFSEDPEMGEEFTVNIKIGNKGKAKAESFHWNWYSTSSNKACDGEVDGLAVGETETVKCKYTYGGWAEYTTKAVVDSKSEVQESNESNNETTKKITPIHEEAKPDLYISEYKFNHPPKQGEEFTVSISIYNKGDTAAESFWWEWWPTAYDKACREKIDSMAAHGGRVVTCTYTYGGWSTYPTKAVADADDDVSEADESNNTHTENVVPIR